MVVKLSREMTGQRGFTVMDKFRLKIKLKTLHSRLYSGFPSSRHEGVMYRAKLARTADGLFGSIVIEFQFQSGNRVRFLLCNGCHPNDIARFSSSENVRQDRVINLVDYDTWLDVRRTIIKKLVDSEDARGNASLYRGR
ncbi:hypothetical protein CN495_07505 [Bacillus thuringiensis]|uniref:Uncharacterized protein n=1 Tax=Bacillus thuringiensis TaxID=1428 RepID=A0ABD6SKK1_BACTU|nr:hypothetical protein [Bacillus thuringiensis]PER55592.1 hypothetical protein CN495_07505 [Bacillus thuringiensis]